MKNGFLAVALVLLALAAPAQADERILSYDSRITVERDGTLEVREEIRVRAEGDNIRRGIYRDFPTIYPGKDGRQIVVGFAFQGACGLFRIMKRIINHCVRSGPKISGTFARKKHNVMAFCQQPFN